MLGTAEPVTLVEVDRWEGMQIHLDQLGRTATAFVRRGKAQGDGTVEWHDVIHQPFIGGGTFEALAGMEIEVVATGERLTVEALLARAIVQHYVQAGVIPADAAPVE